MQDAAAKYSLSEHRPQRMDHFRNSKNYRSTDTTFKNTWQPKPLKLLRHVTVTS
jgi:hypothetical protein